MDTDKKPWLRARETELESLITAIAEVNSSNGWRYLKENVFTGAIESLEKRLMQEAKKNDPDRLELIRLNSQLVSIKKTIDLDEMDKLYRTELVGIQKQLKD